MPRTALPWLYVDITTFDANFQLSNFSSSRGRLSLLMYRNNNKMFRPTFYFIFIRLVLFISWHSNSNSRERITRERKVLGTIGKKTFLFINIPLFGNFSTQLPSRSDLIDWSADPPPYPPLNYSPFFDELFHKV